MPLYEFECKPCNAIFERLCDVPEDAEKVICPSCKGKVDKLISTFSHNVAGGSPSETVDVKIGREAEKRWMGYEQKKANREKNRAGKGYKEIPVLGPKAADGRHMPVMALGDHKEKVQRKDYSGALQEHRTDRIKKGQSQFDGPGVF